MRYSQWLFTCILCYQVKQEEKAFWLTLLLQKAYVFVIMAKSSFPSIQVTIIILFTLELKFEIIKMMKEWE